MRYLWDSLGLKENFDGIFCTCDIGSDKTEPAFNKFILDRLKLEASEVLFFDDTQANVDTARALGIEAYFYNGMETLNERTSTLLK